MITGLVVFIVSVTGAIYAFQEEINLLLQTGVYKRVTPQDQPMISPLMIKQTSESYFKKEIISMNATVYPKGDRATIVWVRDIERKYTAIVLNPYSGEVINSFPYNVNFWAIILGLHTSLLIPEIGHHIVSISTLIFIVLMITGIVLWFPKRRKNLKQRLTIKWNASPKRLNYDLHNVLGFYVSWIIIFMIITGLVLSYDWVRDSVYWLATTEKLPKNEVVLTSSPPDFNSSENILSQFTLVSIIEANPDLNNYFIEYAIDSTDYYELVLNNNKGYFFNKHDKYAIDQYSGGIIQKDLWKDKNRGDVLLAANLNIHIGSILGFPGKVLAFFASLIAASLPVSGFLIWRGRKYKTKK